MQKQFGEAKNERTNNRTNERTNKPTNERKNNRRKERTKEKGRKKGGKRGENSEKEKQPKKKQAEIRLFTSTIQMVLDSPLSWTLIAVQKKGKLRELWKLRLERTLIAPILDPQNFSIFSSFFEGLGLN